MDSIVSVREAILEDRQPIWLWWNDPHTRKMMKRQELVPWEEHVAWFDMISSNPNMILLVGIKGSERIGNTRFDLRGPNVYEVSINLNPTFRGQGLATKLILASIDYLNEIRRVDKFIAGFKQSNIPSMRSFLSAGFAVKTHPSEPPNLRDFQKDIEFYCERPGQIPESTKSLFYGESKLTSQELEDKYWPKECTD